MNCPFCNADLDQGLTFVEDGCTNYVNYEKVNGKWELMLENNGENATEAYWTCRECGRKLPPELQTKFEEEV